MKIMIDIDEYIFERATKNLPLYPTIVDNISNAIKNGTPLPKEKQPNAFAEVVDFFNDIMDTLYSIAFPFGESPDKVRFARSVVYKVFSRRYKIKEIEKNE